MTFAFYDKICILYYRELKTTWFPNSVEKSDQSFVFSFTKTQIPLLYQSNGKHLHDFLQQASHRYFQLDSCSLNTESAS